MSNKNLKFSTVLTGLARAATTRQVRIRSFMISQAYVRKQNKKELCLTIKFVSGKTKKKEILDFPTKEHFMKKIVLRSSIFINLWF